MMRIYHPGPQATPAAEQAVGSLTALKHTTVQSYNVVAHTFEMCIAMMYVVLLHVCISKFTMSMCRILHVCYSSMI